MNRKTKTSANTVKRPRSEKLSRAEKSEKIKNDLFHAAAKVVGDSGYLNAMILSITQQANVANGTFYNYFTSRQELFDQMLPRLGREMLDFIASQSDSPDPFDREVQRFNAFFQYLHENPEFYRILYEAEVFAPDAFVQHNEQVTKGYAGILRKALNAGEITGYHSTELDVLALILMGARHYIAMYLRHHVDSEEKLPDWILETYRKFITGGLLAVARDEG